MIPRCSKGVVLDDTLSFNDHVDYVRTKVSKILGMFSRIRPSLTLEAANRLYKAMVLPVLDYCDAVWHECGQRNSDKMERLQRRAGSSTTKLPQIYQLIKL